MSAAPAIDGVHIILYRQLTVSYTLSALGVLLYKRTLDAPIYPGYWGTIGGRRDEHDPSAEMTALRELDEELGITLAQGMLKELGIVQARRGHDRVVPMLYFAHRLQRDMSALTLRYDDEHKKTEGEGLGWFTAEETQHMVLRPEDRVALGMFFREYGV